MSEVCKADLHSSSVQNDHYSINLCTWHLCTWHFVHLAYVHPPEKLVAEHDGQSSRGYSSLTPRISSSLLAVAQNVMGLLRAWPLANLQ
jgi:hypothetical protein